VKSDSVNDFAYAFAGAGSADGDVWQHAVVFAALPAGMLADIVERRPLLLFIQTWMVIMKFVCALLSREKEFSYSCGEPR